MLFSFLPLECVWRLAALTSASGWASVAVGLSWKLSGDFVYWNNKQAVSSEDGGVTQGASTKASSLRSLSLTHVETLGGPNSWLELPQNEKGDFPFTSFTIHLLLHRRVETSLCFNVTIKKKKKKMFNQTGRDDFPHRCLVCVEPPFWLQVICHYDSRNVDLSTVKELHFFLCWSCFGLGKLKGSKNCCCAKFHITPGEESPRASENNFWLQLQVTRCSKLRLNRGANNRSWKFPLSGSQVRCVKSHNPVLDLQLECWNAQTVFAMKSVWSEVCCWHVQIIDLKHILHKLNKLCRNWWCKEDVNATNFSAFRVAARDGNEQVKPVFFLHQAQHTVEKYWFSWWR